MLKSIIRIIKVLIFLLLPVFLNFFCFIIAHFTIYNTILEVISNLRLLLDTLINVSLLMTIPFWFYYLIFFCIYFFYQKKRTNKLLFSSFYLTVFVNIIFLAYALFSLWTETKSTSALGFVFIPIILLFSLPIANIFIYFLLKLFVKKRE